MNDQPGAGTGNGADTAEQAETPQLVVGPQYICDLSFENPLGLEGMVNLQEAPEIGFDINTAARAVSEDTYEIILSIRAEARVEDKTAFIVELSYAGAFQLAGVSPEDAHPVMLIEGPRHLFPFARAIIADVVRDGGFPPLLINPIDFAAMYASQIGHDEGEDSEEPDGA